MGYKVIKSNAVIHKISVLRNARTSTKVFREVLTELSIFLAFESTKELVLETRNINTPVTNANVEFLKDEQFYIVPILRAGLGMVDAYSKMFPNTSVYHVGLQRDHDTQEISTYFNNLPDCEEAEKHVFILDPMLATGNSSIDAIQYVYDRGYKNIHLVTVISSREGIEKVSSKFPDVAIVTATIDEEMNKDKYITPGLGDAGDRIFGQFDYKKYKK